MTVCFAGSLVPKLEAPASRLFLWRGRERTEPVGKVKHRAGFPKRSLGNSKSLAELETLLAKLKH
jgi:hypothetical protein